MTYTFRHFYIRDEMLESLQRYIQTGCEVGDFLTAVLDNDLMEACGRADDENLQNLPAFCAYLYNECPSDCFGSKAKRLAWIKALSAVPR